MVSNRCAVCKILNEICAPDCICKPHFPSHNTRLENVYQIFGAVNVRNILTNLGFVEHEIAANSLCYAAEARRRDSISGCHGMVLHYESILNNVEQDIQSTVNEVETNIRPDQVPKFIDLPIPNDLPTTSASLASSIERIKSLTAVEKNQLMQLWKREDQKMGNNHEDDGASTSGGPSTA